MIGYGAIFLALIATCIAAFYFFSAQMASSTGKNRKPAQANAAGCLWYRVTAVCTAVAGVYLYYLILNNQFSFAYVAGYSGRDLPLVYKISAFWAGQEGSFLLWLIFHVGFGLLLLRRASVPQPGVMAVFSLLQAVLIIILLAKNPFMMLAEPKLDGIGLNPLLQDPWMVIHPPIVFLGYAGLAVPFAFAIDSLLRKQYTNWIAQALPWTLFSWSMLGAGIFIGGFWAYKVLGWGGYWAWDPVENASLVPWLVAGALIHCLLLARKRPAGVKAAYLTAIASFALVLYGTFLTRSGILSNFSIHSFADEGVGGLLAGMVLIVTVGALALLIVRWQELPQGELYSTVRSREFMLSVGALALGVLATLVLIGMSTPLMTMALGNAQNVSTSFYNATSLPLTALLAWLLAVSPLLGWGSANNSIKKYSWLFLAALPGAALPFWLEIRNPLMIVSVAGAFAALATTLYMAVRRQGLTWPAATSHLGAALLIIGIIISSAGSQTTVISFSGNEAQTVYGYNLTYNGPEPAPNGKGLYQNFNLQGAGIQSSLVQPYTKFNKNGDPAAREPGIYRGILADLYVAPLVKDEEDSEEVEIRKGQTVEQSELSIKLNRISMSGGMSGGDVRVQALLEVTYQGKTAEVVPEMGYRNGKLASTAPKAFDRYEIALGAVNPGEGVVRIAYRDLQNDTKPQKIEVEISRKPLINLVWLGTLLITIGSCWAAFTGKHVAKTEQRALVQ